MQSLTIKELIAALELAAQRHGENKKIKIFSCFGREIDKDKLKVGIRQSWDCGVWAELEEKI